MNRKPEESSFPSFAFHEYIGRLDELDSEDEVYLDATHFGRSSKFFLLSNVRAPFDRLRELYDSPLGDKAIQTYSEFGFGSWETEEALQCWEIVNDNFPGTLGDADIEYATNGTLLELKSILTKSYMPYIRGLEQRFS